MNKRLDLGQVIRRVMDRYQSGKQYRTADIYYCDCCGEFYNCFTDAPAKIDLSTLPDDLALLVTLDRVRLENEELPPSTVRSVSKTPRRDSGKLYKD